MTTRPKESKAQRAYREIRRMIFEGEFSTSRRWSQRGISRLLGMSMVPVSEAVRRLEQQKLLKTKSRSGIRLRMPTDQEHRDMLILREAIEVQAAHMIAQRHRPPLGKLRRLGVRLGKFLQAGKYPEAIYTDCEFHRELVALAGSPLLSERFDEITLCLVNSTGWNDLSSWASGETQSPDNHVALVEALAGGKPDRAERAIRNHIKIAQSS